MSISHTLNYFNNGFMRGVPKFPTTHFVTHFSQHKIHLLNEIQIYSIIRVAHKFSVIHKNFNQ